ncbi:MAG: glycosyltransferase family 4 protein [Anaerolineae bacterium]|nr:glycosyltransferase family 4 protein [Anaerolineae bacterium]
MRIVMFSVNPLFPGYVMGGAPKHLQNIALYLGALGHEVTILCTQSPKSKDPFTWADRVQVLPILRFRQPFPAPYAVPAYDLAAIVQTMGEYLAQADRFYMHDGELLFPYLYQDIPTVVSLRDNVYPETIHGGFLFAGHRLILISEYSRHYYAATVGRFFPELHERTIVIHNGLDWERFKPTPPSEELLNLLSFDPSEHRVILHPHRPEATKGIRQTLAVIDLLVHQYGMTTIKTLIPKWLDVQESPDLLAFYQQIEQEIEARQLGDHIVFHEWIPQRLMPEYYSLGDVTFSLGSFPESFGNAVYESLGCGTPSIAARISTHRELLPDGLLDKVDFDDAEAAAAIAASIIQSSRRTSPETLAYLKTYYSIERQLQAYADVILNAEIASPMQYRHAPIDESTRFKLAPWCYANALGRVYHDFRADYASLGVLGTLLDQHQDGITFTDARQADLRDEDILRWYREGYLVPM